MAALKEPTHRYPAMDMPGYDDRGYPIAMRKVEQLLERLVAPKVIELKVSIRILQECEPIFTRFSVTRTSHVGQGEPSDATKRHLLMLVG